MVGRQVGLGLRQHHRRASRPTPASSATARSARSGRSICRPMPTACAPASRELGPHLLGEDPRAARQAQPPRWTPRSRAIRTSSRGIDIACWDILGQVDGPAGLRAARRPLRRRLCASIARSRRSRPRRWPARSPAIAPRAIAASSSRSAAIPTSTSSASAPSPAMLQPGDRLVADANTGWLHARGDARRPRRCATSTSTSSSRA